MTPVNNVHLFVNSSGTNCFFFPQITILALKLQGPVVQSIVSLTGLLRGQLIKYFTTLLLNTLIFFVEKMTESFALQ